MEEVSWKTVFSGKLNVVFNDNRQVEVFPCGRAQLCVFAMSAIRALRNQLPTGAEVVKSWRIKRFSRKEGILEIEKIKV